MDKQRLQKIIRLYEQAKAEAKDAKEKLDAASEMLKQALIEAWEDTNNQLWDGENAISVVVGASRIKLTHQVTKRIDTKLVREMYPDVAQACITESSHVRLSMTDIEQQ